MMEKVALDLVNPQVAGICRKDRHCPSGQTTSSTVRFDWCFGFEPRLDRSPKATQSWRWRKQSADWPCLDRDAGWEVPHASRTEGVFQPRERLQPCRRTDGPIPFPCHVV